jgi:hypothetical protein
MAPRTASKGLLKAPDLHDDAPVRNAEEQDDLRPRNAPPNTYPTEGFSIEVDGKLKAQYPTAEQATKVGAELKRKFPVLQVMVYDAAAKTRTMVEAAAK